MFGQHILLYELAQIQSGKLIEYQIEVPLGSQ
jgi:hypothetical protein